MYTREDFQGAENLVSFSESPTFPRAFFRLNLVPRDQGKRYCLSRFSHIHSPTKQKYTVINCENN